MNTTQNTTPTAAIPRASRGTPCNHEHTEDCYTLVTECVHEHTEDCYPAESVSDNTDSPSDAENQEPVNCTHECSEDTGCIKKGLDCQHEYDGDCGYAPATEGTPCGNICEICNPQDSGQPEDKPGENECICTEPCAESSVNKDCPVCGAEGTDLSACKGEQTEQAQTITIVGFDELAPDVAEQTVQPGTALEDLNLPDTLGASAYMAEDDTQPITIEGVTWEPDGSYDPTAEVGGYLFAPVLPEGYVLAEGVELPEIAVMVLAADNAIVPMADVEEQFDGILTPGSTYWFDLSGAGIPGEKNDKLPDGSFHWVPFTYVGTINAYSRNSAGVSTDETVVLMLRKDYFLQLSTFLFYKQIRSCRSREK